MPCSTVRHLSRRERSICASKSGEGFRSLDRAKPLTRAFGATSPYGRGGVPPMPQYLGARHELTLAPMGSSPAMTSERRSDNFDDVLVRATVLPPRILSLHGKCSRALSLKCQSLPASLQPLRNTSVVCSAHQMFQYSAARVF